MTGVLGDLTSIARAKAEAEAANLGDEFKAFMEQKFGAAPALVTDVKDAAELTTSDLLEIVKSLKAEIQSLKSKPNSAADAVIADALSQGGAPVPHDLHLSDGRVIAGHGGLATHYDDGNTITRVIGAYPSAN